MMTFLKSLAAVLGVAWLVALVVVFAGARPAVAAGISVEERQARALERIARALERIPEKEDCK